MTFTKIEAIRKQIENRKGRSAWDRGINLYALELLDEVEERSDYEGKEPEDLATLTDYMLNGAKDWKESSWGGSHLIYNGDIAERLCTPSELKRTKNGERRPNNNEEWLDTQARALFQAAERIKRTFQEV